MKDIVPRYRTMAGNYVPRVFGWDCHGLPAELEAEKQLGINQRHEVEEMGLEKFNEVCATSVLKYADEWEAYVNRQARWVDFENGYKTMDIEFMESVMWAFKELYDKGLIYQGFRVLPYSWAEHTSLSNQETRLDDSYKERQDPSLTVSFPLTGARSGSAAEKTLQENPIFGDVEAVAWTTTPWTLPSNSALAVNPKVTYTVVRVGESGADGFAGKLLLLADDLRDAYLKELGKDHEVVLSLPGADLVGFTYEPIFGYFPELKNGCRSWLLIMSPPTAVLVWFTKRLLLVKTIWLPARKPILSWLFRWMPMVNSPRMSRIIKASWFLMPTRTSSVT